MKVTLPVSTVLLAVGSLLIAGCSADQSEGTAQEGTDTMASPLEKPFAMLSADAPVADKRPVEIEQHGEIRIDNYGWMRDDNWQEVLRDPSVLKPEIHDHLVSENDFYKAATGDLEQLRERLFEEMRGRIKEDDSSVPLKDGPFAYARRYREGGEYAIYVRTPRDGGDETILFDGDEEGEGEAFFNVGAVSHSPNHELIAYSVDRVGSEYFDIRVRNVESGEEYAETIGSTNGGITWAADSNSFYYIENDDNQRPKRVKHHVLGTDAAADVLVYEEADDGFFLDVGKSQSRQYIFIGAGNTTTTEYQFLRADAAPGTEPVMIAPRLQDEQYYVDHHGGHFYIRANRDDAVDFKIMRAPIDRPGRDNWEDWLPYAAGTFVSGMVTLADRIVRIERSNALQRLVVSDYSRDDEYEVEFDEEAFFLSGNPGFEHDTDTIRFTYQSPSTPEQTWDFNMDTRERELRKTQEVPSGHNPDLYQVERFFITARDGAQVPVTILRLKATPVDGTAPLLLYGYGSYGFAEDSYFSTSILSLVDRGVIYATAHIRGGSDMGRQWYLDGKLEKKMNTFTDFADAAAELQERGYGRKGETVIYGGSAGGMLVGAAVNLHPELFGGVIAAVPFVDVINTISDAGLPLTPPEWVEWGDPINDPRAFKTMLAYSPYENIRDGVEYPPILATGGLADYRVTYWEPSKWVARLREEASGGPFFLKMNMEAGHAGSAARFERMRERTHEYAFALRILGLTERQPVSHE